MNRVEVKNKLKGILRCVLLSDSDAGLEIPDGIAHQILQNYGCTVGEKSNEVQSLDGFLKNLQSWIENNHVFDEPSVKIVEKVDPDLNLYEKYTQAETEYCDVMSELTKVLEDLLKQKELYSKHFKNECHSQDTNSEVLNKKCQFLKLQFFLKLYGEENALRAHLTLRNKLREELDSLKKRHNQLLEYNKQMSEIKNDKTFCDLFKVYKELRRIEQMTEIIGTM